MKYFTLREITFSPTAAKMGIDNTPSPQSMRNLTKLIDQVLDPARELWNHPIIVTSGYRCKQLNKLVGGVSDSQHLTGCAADIQALGNNRLDNYRLYRMIKDSCIPYDQLIAEGYRCQGCNWVHISFSPQGTNRHMAFAA